MWSNLKRKYASICCIVLGLVCAAIIAPNVIKLFSVRKSESSMIYITAAHIPHEQIVGYTFLYEDEESDTAYYLNDNYTYSLPNKGEIVKFGEYEGAVTDFYGKAGFIVEPNSNSDIYKGLSGARVVNKSHEEIGFISSYKKDKLYCISTK